MTTNKFFSCAGALVPLAVCGFFLYFSNLFSQAATQTPDSEKNRTDSAETILTPPKTDPRMKGITLVTSYMLEKQHYSGRKLSPEISKFIFDEYLKNLDPAHMFFTQEDINEFAVNREKLHSQLKKGSADFAFDVFARFLARLGQYEFFAAQFIKNGVKLDSDSTFLYDRSKTAWPKDEKELAELWKRKLTNDLILAKLSDRAADENAKNNPQKDDSGKVIPHFKDAKTPEERILKRVAQLKNYYTALEGINVLELYLSTVAGVFDPHSMYMSPKTGEDFDIAMSLSLQGIGATLTIEDGYTKVVSLVPGGPAEKEGHLKADDRIIAVRQEGGENVDVIDMPLSKVVDMIRGKSGTKVILTVLEGVKGGSGVPATITITRDKVEIKDSEARGEIRVIKDASGAEKKIGVIVLPSFYIDFEAARRREHDFKSSSNDVKKILSDFKASGVDGVIMDIRSNGGGSLYEAIALTGLFIDKGPVVQVREKNGIEISEDLEEGAFYSGPLIVLVNKLSASASEIFAAAIRDYGRGFVAGDAKTHGKGTVQTVSELDRYMPLLGGAKFKAGFLKLTNAKFYRINGESTQIRGVASDIVYPAYTDFMETGEDKLEHALAWDVIPSAEYTPLLEKTKADAIAEKLAARSRERIAQDRDFKRLNASIEDFKRMKERKEVSLDIEKRWSEYLAEKKIADEQEKLYMDGRSKLEKDDLYLRETLNVMLDLLSLGGASSGTPRE